MSAEVLTFPNAKTPPGNECDGFGTALCLVAGLDLVPAAKRNEVLGVWANNGILSAREHVLLCKFYFAMETQRMQKSWWLNLRRLFRLAFHRI